MIILQQYILHLDGHRWRLDMMPYVANLFIGANHPSVYFHSSRPNHFELFGIEVKPW